MREPLLVMRPEGFFSHRFRLHVEAQHPDGRPARPARAAQAQRVDLDALRMTMLIAVPFLLYWVVSSAP
ncbi:hypothetical protein [Sphingobium sp. CR28]|uniref:hypothetical protein n=1 Tax=Sphingobium sp. CR28 TaxID=3400272 RepID=UPI003FEF9FC1